MALRYDHRKCPVYQEGFDVDPEWRAQMGQHLSFASMVVGLGTLTSGNIQTWVHRMNAVACGWASQGEEEFRPVTEEDLRLWVGASMNVRVDDDVTWAWRHFRPKFCSWDNQPRVLVGILSLMRTLVASHGDANESLRALAVETFYKFYALVAPQMAATFADDLLCFLNDDEQDVGKWAVEYTEGTEVVHLYLDDGIEFDFPEYLDRCHVNFGPTIDFKPSLEVLDGKLHYTIRVSYY